MADPKWLKWNFETCPAGVSSAVEPELLPVDQFAWGGNIDIRGGKPQTRPNFHARLILPSGLVQGASYFGVQGGIAVVSIDGRIYRLRISASGFDYEEIPLPWRNSAEIKQVYMQQTVETLVIQDGQSSPILYNGSTARRAGALEVPRGRQMAYGNGRLWVAVNAKELLAGDIRTNTPGSELMFTEAQYLSGGGKLYFPRGITGLAFIPVTGTTDYGALVVGGIDYAQTVRADITQRDLWASYPGFVTTLLGDTGVASHWSLIEINQDLYWRDSNGGIRSLRASLNDESGPGNSPISREVSRLVNYDSQELIPFCSAINFDNRLLMTTSPYLNKQGGVSWKNLVSLDFAPLSTMRGKSTPAYNGQWTGLSFSQLFSGKFNGRNRAFAISSDENMVNQLWEIGSAEREDIYVTCGSGTTESVSPITCWVEYPRRDFGIQDRRKRIERLDVWLGDIDGEVTLTAYWRADNNQKWTEWDSVETCEKTSDPTTSTPHTWKNLLKGQRPQVKTFTAPDAVAANIGYAANVGFDFQIRLVWTGRCKIFRTMMLAQALDDPDYANRETVVTECLYNDVTGNGVEYVVPGAESCQTIELRDTLSGTLPGTECNWTLISGNADTIIEGCNFTAPDYGTYVFSDGQTIVTVVATTGMVNEWYCRTRGGDASLCGFSELTNPSVPPKKYLEMVFSGSTHADVYLNQGASCTTPDGGYFDVTLTGSALYDPETCELVTVGTSSTSENGGPPTIVYLTGAPGYPDECVTEVTETQTLGQAVSTEVCCATAININQIHVGTRSWQLAQEFTEEDAIDILFPTPETGWGSYGIPYSGACSQPDCCLAFWEQRGDASFDFQIQQAQSRNVGYGANPGNAYAVQATYKRRPYGSTDDFEVFQTVNLPLTINPDGSYELTDEDIPNEPGFETFMAYGPVIQL